MSKNKQPDKMVQSLLDLNRVQFERIKSGNHIKFVVSYKGKKGMIVAPSSASCSRALMNLYMDTRRTLRSIGVNFVDMKSLARG